MVLPGEERKRMRIEIEIADALVPELQAAIAISKVGEEAPKRLPSRYGVQQFITDLVESDLAERRLFKLFPITESEEQ